MSSTALNVVSSMFVPHVVLINAKFQHYGVKMIYVLIKLS